MGQKRGAVSYKEAINEQMTTEEKLEAVISFKDVLIVTAESLGLTALIAYGFFDSLYGMIMLIPVGLINMKRYMIRQNKKRQEKIRQEFKEILLSVAALLQTGYSVENAFYDAKEVLVGLYGEKSELIEDLSEMNRQVAMHVSVEKAFMGIVKKYPLEEIESFGEIFLYTKRLGGGYAKYLKDTADRLEERISLRSELESMIAQKKLELSIMSVMPIAILLYMRLTGGSFLTPLYHNVTGLLVMTISLFIYVGSVALGNVMITKVMNRL